MEESTFGVYNYRTEEMEYKTLPLDSWRDHIPQHPSALALYDLYTKNMGLSPGKEETRVDDSSLLYASLEKIESVFGKPEGMDE